MATPTYEVHIDWGDDGTFAAGDAVTTFVQGEVVIERGRDTARSFSPPMAATAAVTLDNSDRRFSRDYASSPLFPDVRSGHALRIRAVHSSITYPLFQGPVQSMPLDVVGRTVHVESLAGVSALVGVTISTDLYEGIRTGEAIGVILDEIGWPVGARQIDSGSTMLPFWWEDDAGALESMLRLVACEGPGSRIDINADGDFIFEDRYHRLLNSGTSQATFADAGPLYMAQPVEVDDGESLVVNDVSIQVKARTKQPLGQIWVDDETASYLVEPGETKAFHITLDAPAANIQVPDIGEGDFSYLTPVLLAGFAGPANVTISRTSGQSVIVVFTADPTDKLLLWGVRLRGQSAPIVAETNVTAEDATSITTWGPRGLPSGWDAPFLDELHAEAIAAAWIHQYADPVSSVTFAIDSGSSDTHRVQILARDVSDRITVTETVSAMAAVDHFIEKLQHRIHPTGLWHTLQVWAERVVAPVVPANQIFILGHATQGKVGTGKLG